MAMDMYCYIPCAGEVGLTKQWCNQSLIWSLLEGDYHVHAPGGLPWPAFWHSLLPWRLLEEHYHAPGACWCQFLPLWKLFVKNYCVPGPSGISCLRLRECWSSITMYLVLVLTVGSWLGSGDRLWSTTCSVCLLVLAASAMETAGVLAHALETVCGKTVLI